MMKPGLALARHRHVGARLGTIRDELLDLGVEVANAYPKRQSHSRALLRARVLLDAARSGLDDAAAREHPGEAADDAYYGERIRAATRVLDPAAISATLDALLNAILDHEEEQRARSPTVPRFKLIPIADLIGSSPMTRRESAIAGMTRDPIGEACRQGIRLCGEQLHALGGISLMEATLSIVAGTDLRRHGSRSTIMDHAWDGIGDEWWS